MYRIRCLVTLMMTISISINVSDSSILVDGRRLGENTQDQSKPEGNGEQMKEDYLDYMFHDNFIDHNSDQIHREFDPVFEYKESEEKQQFLSQTKPLLHRAISEESSSLNSTSRQTSTAENTRTFKTDLGGKNRSWGNMFDVEALNSLDITNIYIHTQSTIYVKFEVWTKSGSHVGYEDVPTSWTLLGSGYTIGQGEGALTPLPSTTIFKDGDGIHLDAGDIIAFYIRLDEPYLKYDNGDFDHRSSDLIVYSGKALSKTPFGKTYAPRIWNGAFDYIIDSSVQGTPVYSDKEIFVTLGGKTGSYGIKFDIYAKRNIVVKNFHIHIVQGSFNIMVYTKAGTHVGAGRSLDGWTQILPLTPIQGEGTLHLTQLPVDAMNPVFIAAETTQSFFIGATKSGIRYSKGQSGPGLMFIENDDLSIMEGSGVGGFPTGTHFSPRVFNGLVQYETGREAPNSPQESQVSPSTKAQYRLETTMAGGTGSYANMFTVIATSRDVTIVGLELHMADNSADLAMVEVYTKEGSFEGFERDLNSWERVFVGIIEIQGKGKTTPLLSPNPFTPVTIKAGSTQSFYVTSNKPNIRYTRGNNAGSSYASNGDIEVLEGIGIGSYPFKGNIYSPRLFNGVILYNAYGTAMPTPYPTIPEPTDAPLPTKQPSLPPTPEKFQDFQTNFIGDNGSYGNMVSVFTKVDSLLKTISVHARTTSEVDVVVFAMEGSFRGSELSVVGWRKIFDSKVTGAGYLKKTLLPTNEFQEMKMCAGKTYSFYITLKEKSIRYTNISPGSMSIENDDFLIRPEDSVGVGRYPFGTIYKNRMWNGVLHYTYGSCSQTTTSSQTVPGLPSIGASSSPPSPSSEIPTRSPSKLPTRSPTDIPTKSPSQTPLLNLFTDFRGDKRSYGIMFDMRAIRPIKLKTLDIHVASYNQVYVEVYLRVGRFSGYEYDSQGWEKLFAGYVQGKGYMKRTKLPRESFTEVKICPGETMALYTTMSDKILFHSTIPVDVSNPDIILDLSSGVSVDGFGFDPQNLLTNRRTWNGVIQYSTGGNCNPTISPAPSKFPSFIPSYAPSNQPIFAPSHQPTIEPSPSPTRTPTSNPTKNPTHSPTMFPTKTPTTSPSLLPSNEPSYTPTTTPSMKPSDLPSGNPSDFPTTVPSTLPTKLPSISPSMNPSSTPTISHKTIKTAVASSISLDSDLSDPSSAQSQALTWLIDDESSVRDIDFLTKRYVMGVLYYSLGGPQSRFVSDWGSPRDICEWSLIKCMMNEITEIEITSPKVNGFLPPEIRHFDYIKKLIITGSSLGGTIPKELTTLSTLETIDLSKNELTGTIMTEFGSLNNLNWLKLSDNLLTGNLPSEIGQIRNLNSLDIHANQLTGSIPKEFWSLSKIGDLVLSENSLTGTLSPRIGQATSLRNLLLEGNNLSGTIPTAIARLTNLVFISFKKNKLTGTLPPSLGQLTSLQYMVLSSNEFSSTIPSELGSLVNLEKAYFFGNDLTGAVPNEICANSVHKTPPSPSATLNTLQVDCVIQCNCCSHCFVF